MRLLTAIIVVVGALTAAAVCGTGDSAPPGTSSPDTTVGRATSTVPVPPGAPLKLSDIPADILAQGSIFLRQPDAAMRATATIDAPAAVNTSDADTTPPQQVVLADLQHFDEHGVLQQQLVWVVEYHVVWHGINGQPGTLNEALSVVDAVTGKGLFTAMF